MNRYNAPEVLSALFKALEVAGLEDIIQRLKQMGVPSLVNKAWAERPKMATSKQAADFRRVLVNILEPLRPYARNYVAFVYEMNGWLDNFSQTVDPTFLKPKVLSTDLVTVTSDIVTYPQTLNSPAEYAEDDVEVPGTIQAGAVYEGSIQILCKNLTKQFLPMLKDPKGFLSALYLFFEGKGGLLFFRMMEASIRKDSKDTEWWYELIEEIDELASKDLPEHIAHEGSSVEQVTGNRVVAKRIGRNYQIIVTGQLKIGVGLRLLSGKEIDRDWEGTKGDDRMHDYDRY